jgi:predicted oxidoreductase
MKTVLIGNSSLACSRLAYGCWRIAGTWNPAEVKPEAQASGRRAVLAAYEAGYTLFDHADIYCEGMAEKIFGQALKEEPAMRDRILIATKCGIRKSGEPKPDSPYRFDFSGEHIISSCEQSLRRLGVDRIDIYQLHRPDYLMSPEEIAAVFGRLKQEGKVREFGVSNFRPSQLAALQKACPMRLIMNQVEISLANLTAFEDGTLDQCLGDKITPMAWSPLAGGQLADGANRLLPSQQAYRIKPLVAALDLLAKGHGVSRTALALAWLMKHPSGIVPIIGSTNPVRIREACKAAELDLSREDWYRLLEAARGEKLP